MTASTEEYSPLCVPMRRVVVVLELAPAATDGEVDAETAAIVDVLEKVWLMDAPSDALSDVLSDALDTVIVREAEPLEITVPVTLAATLLIPIVALPST